MDVRKAGQEIRRLRLEREWTQVRFASECNRIAGRRIVTQRVVSRYEEGQAGTPLFETVVAMGRALGKTPDQMAAIFET